MLMNLCPIGQEVLNYLRNQNIFLILIEGQDNWPFLPENAPLNLCPNLAKLAKESLYFRNLLLGDKEPCQQRQRKWATILIQDFKSTMRNMV